MKIAIIGAGPGGAAAAIEAAKHGAEVTIIEKNSLGGTCLQRGCIPTKALIAVCKILEKHKKAPEYGFTKIDSEYGFELIFRRNQKIIESQANGIELTFKNAKVNLVNGSAMLNCNDGPLALSEVEGRPVTTNEITVTDEKGQTINISADKIILASGSAPIKPKIFNFNSKNIITSDEILNLPARPENLLIIGAGAIGLEFASIFNAFGTNVTVVEMMPQILPGMDTELANTLARELKKKGIKILTGAKVEKLEDKGGKIIVGANSVRPEGEKILADKVLIAIGRMPYTDGLNLQAAGVQTDAKGYIKVNENLETSAKNIYAIGDLTGNPMLAHKASFEGRAVIKKIFGEDLIVNYNAIPGCVYTIPEAASIGLSEEKAKAENIDYIVKKYFNRALGIAWANGEIEGFAKILANKANNEIIGVHLLGANSTELIGLGSVAVNKKLKISDIAESIFPHPTYSENIYEAASAG